MTRWSNTKAKNIYYIPRADRKAPSQTLLIITIISFVLYSLCAGVFASCSSAPFVPATERSSSGSKAVRSVGGVLAALLDDSATEDCPVLIMDFVRKTRIVKEKQDLVNLVKRQGPSGRKFDLQSFEISKIIDIIHISSVYAKMWGKGDESDLFYLSYLGYRFGFVDSRHTKYIYELILREADVVNHQVGYHSLQNTHLH